MMNLPFVLLNLLKCSDCRSPLLALLTRREGWCSKASNRHINDAIWQSLHAENQKICPEPGISYRRNRFPQLFLSQESVPTFVIPVSFSLVKLHALCRAGRIVLFIISVRRRVNAILDVGQVDSQCAPSVYPFGCGTLGTSTVRTGSNR